MQPDQNRRAIIFGHTSGLGLELSKQLALHGFSIVGVSRSRADLPADIVTQIQADLSQKEEIARVIHDIRETYHSFRVLIYTAGALTAHPVDNLSYEDTEYLYRVNTFAPMIIESGLVDLIESNGADVINVTSSSIREFYPDFSEYSTSKAAFAKFTSDLQRRLAESSARVMELCPSGFTSNMYKNMLGEKQPRDETIQIPVEDLAALIIYAIDLPKRMEITQLVLNRKKVNNSIKEDI